MRGGDGGRIRAGLGREPKNFRIAEGNIPQNENIQYSNM